MPRSFNELREKMGPERVARNKARAEEQLRLYELRQALRYTQEQIAETLNIKQSTVSKMEHNADTLISTLRRYLEAMGVKLLIKAQFPGGEEVEIDQFRDFDFPEDDERGAQTIQC